MENASKALIIAGAILLAILIISLGIMILGKAQDTINGSGMTQAEVQAFNEKFTKYGGEQRGSSIRSLVQEVVSSDGADENGTDNLNRRVSISGVITYTPGDGNSTTTVENLKDIKSTKTYVVEFKYGTNGCVNEVIVNKKN